MSYKMLRPFIVKVSVLGYFPILKNACVVTNKHYDANASLVWTIKMGLTILFRSNPI